MLGVKESTESNNILGSKNKSYGMSGYSKDEVILHVTPATAGI